MKFGDIVFNGWAGERNPQGVGIFVGMSGGYRVFANGKRRWKMDVKVSRQLVVGHLDLSPLHEAMKKAANGEYHIPREDGDE